MTYIQTDMTDTETRLRARIAELESALRLTLAVSPDDPLVFTPAEQQVVALEAKVAEVTKERDEWRRKAHLVSDDPDYQQLAINITI